MQAADGLGAQPGEVVVAVGQHAQDDDVIVSRDGMQTPVAQCRHRGGQSVVGVVLLGASRAQHPHACRQRRGNVDDILAGSQQLLGQQVAESAGGFDCPTPLRKAASPLEEQLALLLGGPDSELAEGNFVAVDGYGGV